MGVVVIRAGSYAVVDNVMYHVHIESSYIVLYEKVAGEPTAWNYEDIEGVTGKSIPRSVEDVSRLFVVLTWANLDGVDVKIEEIDADLKRATVIALYPEGDEGRAGSPHPDWHTIAEWGYHTDKYSGVVPVERLTDVREWAEVDGPVESRVRPDTTPWMGEENNGEPWRRPKLPRKKLM